MTDRPVPSRDIIGSYEYDRLLYEALDKIERLERNEPEIIKALESASWNLVRGSIREQSEALRLVNIALAKAKGGAA